MRELAKKLVQWVRRPRIRYGHWLFRLPGFRNYDGICVGRWILFRESKDLISPTLFHHEMIHQEQMDRLTVAGFYFFYFVFYLRGLVRHGSHELAYHNNDFEVEAYLEAPRRARGIEDDDGA